MKTPCCNIEVEADYFNNRWDCKSHCPSCGKVIVIEFDEVYIEEENESHEYWWLKTPEQYGLSIDNLDEIKLELEINYNKEIEVTPTQFGRLQKEISGTFAHCVRDGKIMVKLWHMAFKNDFIKIISE